MLRGPRTSSGSNGSFSPEPTEPTEGAPLARAPDADPQEYITELQRSLASAMSALVSVTREKNALEDAQDVLRGEKRELEQQLHGMAAHLKQTEREKRALEDELLRARAAVSASGDRLERLFTPVRTASPRSASRPELTGPLTELPARAGSSPRLSSGRARSPPRGPWR